MTSAARVIASRDNGKKGGRPKGSKNKLPVVFKQTPFERFFEKFTPEPFSGCWLWTAGSVDGKYGSLRVKNASIRAHRLSWQLYRGAIPDGLCVLHRCDQTFCVNPDHLFLGTKADNNHDAALKGRSRGSRGERNPAAKLTLKEVELIRNSNFSHAGLARQFGVTSTTISKVRSRHNWKHF